MNPIVKQIIEIPVFWLHCLRTNMCLQHSRDLNPWERKGWELPLTPYPLQHPVIWKLVTQSCLALHNPLDYSLPGSSVHEILQARILEKVVIPFSKGSSQPRDWTYVSCIAGRFYHLSHQGNQTLSLIREVRKCINKRKAVKQDKALMVSKQSYL